MIDPLSEPEKGRLVEREGETVESYIHRMKDKINEIIEQSNTLEKQPERCEMPTFMTEAMSKHVHTLVHRAMREAWENAYVRFYASCPADLDRARSLSIKFVQRNDDWVQYAIKRIALGGDPGFSEEWEGRDSETK